MRDPLDRFHRSTSTLTVTTTHDSTVVAATGDLDGAVAEHLLGRLADEVALRPRALVIDLSRVAFCSARVLRVLLTTSADAHAAGIPCVLVSDQRAVLRPIAVLGLDHLLQVQPSLAAAREWLAVLGTVGVTGVTGVTG
ncbi:STAS domain-containing protein [Amycolatopsis sp. WQ 127309]|uniref:STAS domain-containing protein n=1 Tax=Amycolatopsis sp. WQ 127309 TaxID=2932773 RepID=UPI001FF4C150|nr:STAS domain-containing protein [Amycolatopsis sp. WQ 127309]UOZ03159.1 STAS domain-containing protein [Amycolatopsis sp. WQ 127309]